MSDNLTFNSLQEARKYSHISQAELSKRTGVIQADISRIENDIANPTLNVLSRIAESMNMKLKITYELKK